MGSRTWLGAAALLMLATGGALIWSNLVPTPPAPSNDRDAAPGASAAIANVDRGSERTAAPAAAAAAAVRKPYRGTVESDDHARIAGATIRLFAEPAEPRGEPLATVTTDEQGAFEIVPSSGWPEEVTVVAEAAGHEPTTRDGVAPGHLRLRLFLLVELFGRVTSEVDGRPLAGAAVQGGRSAAVTDELGNYTLDARRIGGDVHVTASHPGFASRPISLRLLEGVRTRVDIALQPLETATVQIVDAQTEAPIVAAEVRRHRGGDVIERSDAHGRFALEIAAGSHVHLHVSSPDYCPVEWWWEVADGDARSLRLPLTRAGVIEGAVRDPEGRPITDAGVAARSHDGRGAGTDVAVETAAFGLPGRLRVDAGAGFDATDREGRFRIAVHPDEKPRRLSVWHDEFVSTTTEPLTLARPGARAWVDVRLARGGTIVGTVRRNGEPWRGEVIYRRTAGEGYGRDDTDAEGNYELANVPPGEVELSLREAFAGAVTRSTKLTVRAGAEHRHDFVWDEERATIRGRVTSSTGAPLAGIHVTAYSSDPLSRQLVQGQTDADGSYTLEVRPPDVFRVSARRKGVTRGHERVAPGASGVDIVLPETGVLRLRLVDAATGEPVEPVGHRLWDVAWKEASEESFRQVHDKLDSTGLVRLDVPIGLVDVNLHLGKSGYAPKLVTGLRVDGSDEPPAIRVELTRGAEVRLRLRDAAGYGDASDGRLVFLLEQSQLVWLRGPFQHQGGPSNNRINGVNVWLRSPALMQQMPHFEGDGTAVLTGLMPGRYRLVAVPDELEFTPAEFAVGSDGAQIELGWRRRPR